MSLTVLRSGIDTLDVAFMGALPGSVRAAMQDAKERAIENMSPEPLEINGVSGLISETGASGGYAFIFDTGKDGELWTFKNNDDPSNWNIRVSVRSARLACHGYRSCCERLFRSLEIFNAIVINESISRIDWAVDFVSSDFVLSAENFVCHSHCGVSEHSEIDEGGSGFAVHYAGRETTSITVGKMPGRQVIVYDKRREQIRKADSVWFGVWGFEREDCPQVWRVELRAGKKHLKDWNITTFDDLDQKMGDMFKDAIEKVRILADGETEKSNVTYANVAPIWAETGITLNVALHEHVSGAVRGRVLTGQRREMAKMYRQQVMGVAIPYAVALGHDAAEAAAEIGTALFKEWQAYSGNQEFQKKFKKTAERLKFLNGEREAGNADGFCYQGSGGTG